MNGILKNIVTNLKAEDIGKMLRPMLEKLLVKLGASDVDGKFGPDGTQVLEAFDHLEKGFGPLLSLAQGYFAKAQDAMGKE